MHDSDVPISTLTATVLVGRHCFAELALAVPFVARVRHAYLPAQPATRRLPAEPAEVRIAAIRSPGALMLAGDGVRLIVDAGVELTGLFGAGAYRDLETLLLDARSAA